MVMEKLLVFAQIDTKSIMCLQEFDYLIKNY